MDRVNCTVAALFVYFCLVLQFAVLTGTQVLCDHTHNLDDANSTFYGAQCGIQTRCTICFESNIISVSKGVTYGVEIYLRVNSSVSKLPVSAKLLSKGADQTSVFVCELPKLKSSRVCTLEIRAYNDDEQKQIFQREYSLLYHHKSIGYVSQVGRKQYLHLGSGTNIIQDSDEGDWFNFDSLLGLGQDWGSPEQQNLHQNLVRWKILDMLTFLPSNSIDLVYMNCLLSVASFPQTIENFKRQKRGEQRDGKFFHYFYHQNPYAETVFENLFHEICKLI